MFDRPRLLCLFLLAGLVSCGQPPAYTLVHEAGEVPRAAGEKVVLKIEAPGGTRFFTLRQLSALRAVEYHTHQPQLKRAFLYRSVLLSDLAAYSGLRGRDLRLEALNNYSATIKKRDYGEYPLLLAYAADGQPIPIASKGPLTLVFPTEAYPRRFPDMKYAAQWVWYVNKVGPQ